MPVKGIAHFCITVSDLAASKKFYTEVMGFTPAFDFKKTDGRDGGFYLKVNANTYLEAFENPGDLPGSSRLTHICFETDDIKALKAEIDERGGETTDITMGADRSWQFWITDPDGIRYEFHQYTENSSQKTGADAEINW